MVIQRVFRTVNTWFEIPFTINNQPTQGIYTRDARHKKHSPFRLRLFMSGIQGVNILFWLVVYPPNTGH